MNSDIQQMIDSCKEELEDIESRLQTLSATDSCLQLSSITIGENVKNIPSYLVKDCIRLTSIAIPDSVASIGDGAFDGCNKLKTVYYKGTAEQWDKISIKGLYNNYLRSATRYYYSENEPALNSDSTAYDGNYWHYDSDGITPVIWKKEN